MKIKFPKTSTISFFEHERERLFQHEHECASASSCFPKGVRAVAGLIESDADDEENISAASTLADRFKAANQNITDLGAPKQPAKYCAAPKAANVSDLMIKGHVDGSREFAIQSDV